MNILNILFIIICSFTIAMPKKIKSETKLKGIDEICKYIDLNGSKLYYKCSKLASAEAIADVNADPEGGEFYGEGYLELNDCIGYETGFLGLGRTFVWKKGGNFFTYDPKGTGCKDCVYNPGLMDCRCRLESFKNYDYQSDELNLDEHVKHNPNTGHLYCDL